MALFCGFKFAAVVAWIAVSSSAFACAPERSGKPLLGRTEATLVANTPTLYLVQQRDVNIEVVAIINEQMSAYDSPGGRNGQEWVYLIAPQSTSAQVCFYAVHRQASPDAYRISPIDLSRSSRSELKALQLMGQAGALWATRTTESRTAAISMYQKVAASGENGFATAEYARLYSLLGMAQRYQFDQALAGAKAMTQDARNSEYVRYTAQWLVGDILQTRDRLEESIAVLTSARDAAVRAQTSMKRSVRRDIVDITDSLGLAHLSAERFASGEQLLREALEMAQDDYYLLGRVHNEIGFVYIQKALHGDAANREINIRLALQHEVTARSYAVKAGNHADLPIIINNIGTMFERLGDVRKAREHYEEALRATGETDDPFLLEMLYRNLGTAYQYLGDYAKSEAFLLEAIAIAKKSSASEPFKLQCKLGTTQRLKGKFTEAIAQHTTCHSGAKIANNALSQANALNELAEDYRSIQRGDDAWQTIQQAAQLAEQVRDVDLQAKILVQQALLMQERKELANARARIEQAMSITTDARYPTARVDALIAGMNIYSAQGNDNKAEKLGLDALSQIESIHAHLDSERLGPAWSARTQDVYARVTAMRATAYWKDRRIDKLWAILDIIERSRAIGLRQQFAAPRNIRQQVNQSELLVTMSELANEAALSAEAADGKLPLAYYHNHDLLTLARLAGVGGLPVPQPLRASQLQNSLSNQQAALYYFTLGDRIYLLLLKRNSQELLDVGSKKYINEQIAHVRQALAARSSKLIPALRNLSGRILPTTKFNDIHEWIVVPDASLHTLPFSALHLGAPTDSYEPVIARHSVKIVPSLSAYFMNKPKRSKDYALDLAAFADPILSQSDPRLGPSKSDQTEFSGWTGTLNRLPWTAREAEGLKRLFPANRTVIYTGSQASRQNLKNKDVLDTRMLHIASHGYFSADSPENVGFALSPTRGSHSVDSGFITLTELFSYQFNTELVVISGCDSAMGLDRGGEGMLGLPRGFIAQGASHVISTLWAVSDKASAEFMALFYAKLIEVGSVSQALQLAQQELRSRSAYSDPFFWAPYTLTTVDSNDRMQFSSAAIENQPTRSLAR